MLTVILGYPELDLFEYLFLSRFLDFLFVRRSQSKNCFLLFVLDHSEVIHFDRIDESECNAFLACTAGTADSVRIAFCILRDVEIVYMDTPEMSRPLAATSVATRISSALLRNFLSTSSRFDWVMSP